MKYAERARVWSSPASAFAGFRFPAETAQVVIAGHTFLQNLRRGHYELGVDVRPPLRVAAASAELAQAI